MTKKKLVLRWVYLICALGCMVTIFLFSSQNTIKSNAVSDHIVIELLYLTHHDSSPEQIKSLNYILRKATHFTIYAIVSVLLMLIFSTFSVNSYTRFSMALVIGFLYAVSDELHQRYSFGRTPSLFDVLIDTAGVITGIFLVLLLTYFHRRRKLREVVNAEKDIDN